MSNNSTDTDVESLWSTFKERCNSTLSKIPSKLISTRKSPALDKQIHKTAISQNNVSTTKLAILVPLFTGILIETIEFKQYTQQQCKYAYENYVRSIVSTELGGNPKCSWSFIKNERLDHGGVGTLRSGDQVYNDNASKSCLLNDYFASVFTEDASIDLPVLPDSPYPTFSDISVTHNGAY